MAKRKTKGEPKPKPGEILQQANGDVVIGVPVAEVKPIAPMPGG